MTALAVSLIRLDGGTQPRATLRHDWIEEYAADMATGATFPPVVVFFDGSDYWLADGYHRTGAAKSIGLETIDADVRQGTQRDAILFSVSANSSHGQRRTNEDKRRAVLRLIHDAEWSGWSDREIARRVGVSTPLVSGMRPPPPPAPHAEMQADTVNSYSIPNQDRAAQPRTFTHPKTGKPAVMNTANIGRRPTAEKEAEVAPAAHAAAAGYMANASLAGERPTMDGLRSAVKEAVHATLGPPPPRPKPVIQPAPPVEPIGNDWVDWTAAIEAIAAMDINFAAVAARTPPRLRQSLIDEARLALSRIPEWIEAMEATNVEAA